MKNQMMVFLAVLIGAVLFGCSDTDKAGSGALGTPGHITCWNGGMVVLEADSTGVIQTVKNSDGWEFKDAKTGRFTRVSGTCIIVN